MAGFVTKVLDKLSQSRTTDVFPPSEYHPEYSKGSWHYINLGTWHKNQHFEWNAYSCGNALVFGPPASGKSAVQNTVIQHCLHHSEHWQIMGISVSGEELVSYMASNAPTATMATTLEDAVSLLRRVKEIMLERYGVMAETNTSFSNMSDDAKRIMVVIDEAADLIHPMPAVDGSKELRLKEEAHLLLDELARSSRAAGINFMVGGITPMSFMSGELRGNFFPVISLGDYDPQSDYQPNQNGWNSPPELLAPSEVKGRGCITTHLGSSVFQSYLPA
ncbi:MAG: hypothetical protein H9W81_08010 [Enterococcus sp.]|nr:hypothetical protein [Enterococcus sp.]